MLENETFEFFLLTPLRRRGRRQTSDEMHLCMTPKVLPILKNQKLGELIYSLSREFCRHKEFDWKQSIESILLDSCSKFFV